VRAADGTKGEPEQQPTRTLVQSTMAASLRTSGAGGAAGQVGNIPLLITHDAPAGEMASVLAARCSRCAWYRNKAWKNLVAECDFPTSPLMKRQAINEVRSALLLTRNAAIIDQGEVEGDFDVEHVMRAHMGLCEALSSVKKDYVVVHKDGCCPEEVKNAGQPSGYFKPRDSEAKKEAQAVSDRVLLTANGKSV
jgi:hypothetical protein